MRTPAIYRKPLANYLNTYLIFSHHEFSVMLKIRHGRNKWPLDHRGKSRNVRYELVTNDKSSLPGYLVCWAYSLAQLVKIARVLYPTCLQVPDLIDILRANRKIITLDNRVRKISQREGIDVIYRKRGRPPHLGGLPPAQLRAAIQRRGPNYAETDPRTLYAADIGRNPLRVAYRRSFWRAWWRGEEIAGADSKEKCLSLAESYLFNHPTA